MAAINLPTNASSSKAVTSSSSNLTAALSQTGPLSSSDGHASRRSGGSGSFGAGANARASAAAPRNKQASKGQHKGGKRYRFADEDAIAESAAMNSTRNRKGQTSITHLMNFTLPPRPSNYNHYQRSGHSRRNPTWGLGSGYHAVDKARFVHANYRFVVDPDRDYHAHSIDADVHLDWAHVLQILVSPQSQASACPICLSDPVAPRMAKCGHIFCLHCLIRYMHSDDAAAHAAAQGEKRARWKKCPICEDSIYVSETRPVRWYIGQEGPPPREHEDIVLRLVMRPAGSTLALPRDTPPMSGDEQVPWHFAVDVMDFARVMKGSRDYMVAQFDEELAQIEEVERIDELMFGEDNEWTSRAMRTVREARERAKALGKAPSESAKPDDPKLRKRPAAGTEHFSRDAPEMYIAQHAARSGQSFTAADNETGGRSNGVSLAIETATGHATHPAAAVAAAGPLAPTANGSNGVNNSHSTLTQQQQQQQQQQLLRNGHHNHHAPADYYFYQALLHHYLAPLDIRILKSAFGDFSQFPSTILPRVEHVSTGHVVDDELRRRTKYLAHLPQGCEVAFLECDWTDTVPAEVLAAFKPEIDRRRRRNDEKETREEKERLRAERAEEAKGYAAARRRRAGSPTTTASRFTPEDFAPLPAGVGGEDGSGVDSSLTAFEPASPPTWRQGGSGFATLGSPGTSPIATSRAGTTVWGTAALAPLSPEVAADESGAVPPDDGWLQGWERDLLTGAEERLIVQTQSISLQQAASSSSSSAAASAPQSGGRKKKGKKITLMSTTAKRGA